MLLASAFAFAQDDVYYIPSKEVRQVKNDKGQTVDFSNRQTDEDLNQSDRAIRYEENRDVDEYNRRYSYAKYDTTAYDESDIKEVNSTFDDSDSEVAYPYTKIVMRFHSPHPGFIVSSPFYWDICYADVWDVYYDSWAFSCPSYTWWSYAYNPWHYNRWYYRTCWDFTWGWYDPWWSHSYWGWSRPIYWGSYRPAFNPHHLGRPMWAHRDIRPSHGYRPSFDRPRGGRDFVRRPITRPSDRRQITRAPGRGDGNRPTYGNRTIDRNNNRVSTGRDTRRTRVDYDSPRRDNDVRTSNRTTQRTENYTPRSNNSSPSFGGGSRGGFTGGSYTPGRSGGGGFSGGVRGGGGGGSRGGGRR